MELLKRKFFVCNFNYEMLGDGRRKSLVLPSSSDFRRCTLPNIYVYEEREIWLKNGAIVTKEDFSLFMRMAFFYI
jgi:hypothetical protein